MPDRETGGPRGDQGVAARWLVNLPLLVGGGVSIVAGGLVAAVTGPTGWEHGSWVAAFLVLVAGVAQVGLAGGQAQLAPAPVGRRVAAVECSSWNAGCLLVIAGTLLSAPVVVAVGSAPLVAVLAMSSAAVRGTERQPRLGATYRAGLVVLAASTAVGIALAFARS